MNTFSEVVPPGFRFHPTEEELVAYYLRKKITSRMIDDLDVIKDVDLYKIEPWDLQGLCRILGAAEEQNEWYFFSHKDKKYPSGTRTNRATAAGFWKATGRDKAIYSKHDLIGMRKTLVFYKGRAPNGLKSDWIMHEYRLETDVINGTSTTPQEEGWVVCRAFKKKVQTTNRANEREYSPCWYDERVCFVNDLDSPMQDMSNCHLPYGCKKELDLQYQVPNDQHYLQQRIPVLESPSCDSMEAAFGLHLQQQTHDQQHLHAAVLYGNSSSSNEHATDWRILDKFVGSQLSQEEEISKENNYNSTVRHLNTQETVPENASTSTPNRHIDLWK